MAESSGPASSDPTLNVSAATSTVSAATSTVSASISQSAVSNAVSSDASSVVVSSSFAADVKETKRRLWRTLCALCVGFVFVTMLVYLRVLSSRSYLYMALAFGGLGVLSIADHYNVSLLGWAGEVPIPTLLAASTIAMGVYSLLIDYMHVSVLHYVLHDNPFFSRLKLKSRWYRASADASAERFANWSVVHAIEQFASYAVTKPAAIAIGLLTDPASMRSIIGVVAVPVAVAALFWKVVWKLWLGPKYGKQVSGPYVSMTIVYSSAATVLGVFGAFIFFSALGTRWPWIADALVWLMGRLGPRWYFAALICGVAAGSALAILNLESSKQPEEPSKDGTAGPAGTAPTGVGQVDDVAIASIGIASLASVVVLLALPSLNPSFFAASNRFT